MSKSATDTNGLLLSGLDGSNPLAFLAALGTLRVVNEAISQPREQPRLAWQIHEGCWRPLLFEPLGLSASGFVELLHDRLCKRGASHRHLELGKNLSVPPETFAEHARQAAKSTDRRWGDFLASFGSEVLTHDKLDRLDYTDICFAFGSGHQNHLETMAKLIQNTTVAHLERSLFSAWDYSDERLSLRWDPADAKEHAYQWTAPGDETTTTMWGANLLAAEGSSLLTTCPTPHGKGTIGICGSGIRAAFFWPIWDVPMPIDVVRSLLGRVWDAPAGRIAAGVQQVYRSQKIKIGEGANFKWSFSPATTF